MLKKSNTAGNTEEWLVFNVCQWSITQQVTQYIKRIYKRIYIYI